MSGESYENIKNRRGMTMNEEDRDIVEFTDEDGNSLPKGRASTSTACIS